MKAASNGSVLNGSIQALHVHVLLVAPLSGSYMVRLGTNRHQSKAAVQESAHYTGAVADLPVQPLNHIIGADASPVLAGKITVGQGFLNAILHLLGCHGT